MKNLLLPVLFCWLLPAKAQQGFMLYTKQGKVYVKNGAKKRMVKTGDLLSQHTKVFMEANASATFICSNYSHFSIKKKGSFLLSSFTDSCVKDKPGFSKAYFSYLWKQFSQPHQSPEKLRREYMQNTGAVIRGCPDLHIDSRFDSLLFIAADKGYLRWHSPLSQDRLSFVLYDAMEAGNLLYEKKMPGTSISIDSIRQWIETGNELYWNIKADGEEKCTRKYLLQVQEQTFSNIENEASLFLPASSSPGEYAFSKGFIAEYNRFLFKAVQYYKQATALAPLNNNYKAAAATLE